MNGTAFLELARELATSGKEEHRRTSISRAYYGTYHAVRDLVQGCDVIVPKRDVHNKLQWCLQQMGEKSGDKELAKVGSKLGDLRTERNKADYELDDQRIAKPAVAMKSVQRAEQVVAMLARYSKGDAKNTLRPYVRSFAQQQGWQLR